MSIQHSSDSDLLIAEYTLGLLNLQETAQAQTLLGKDPEAVAIALKWEDRFLDLVDQLPPIEPPAHLLQRIQATLGMEITLVKRPNIVIKAVKKVLCGIWRGLWFWRGLSVALLLIALAYAAKPNLAVIEAPPIVRVAVLQAPGQSSTPGWVATLDKKNNLFLNPKVHTDIPPDASMRLWTHNDSAPEPRPLGIIEPNRATTIPASSLGAIGQDQIFEMTLEPKSGSSAANPSGTVLFIGRMITLDQQPG